MAGRAAHDAVVDRCHHGNACRAAEFLRLRPDLWRAGRSHDRAVLFLACRPRCGYRRGTHWDKPWLLNAADRVQTISERFAIQLNSCRHDLEKNWFQRLLS